MQDYSDTGYAYLGEHLASRGIIFASIDENFINSSWTDLLGGLEEENDARGWILLEHLRQWHNWNRDEEHLFFNKVDTTSLALIGHSRGGEAVGHSALLNTLPFYPDDVSQKLGYNYNIKSIAAIAPVDGQYQPGNTRSALKDINYFVLHGSQDADVTSFAGVRQYERVSFTQVDSTYYFKSGLYIQGANHGQFNTSWGNNDVSVPFTRLLNLKQLLPEEEQREIAKVYLSAFLEVTLKDKLEYLPLFADARAGRDWLPETIFLNQFADANTWHLAHYDEDFDVTTASLDSVTISGSNLTVWKEQEIQTKWGKKGSRGAVIGWHYNEKLIDSLPKNENDKPILPDSIRAHYSVKIEARDMSLDSSAVLVFSMAESTIDSNPKSKGKWVEDSDEDGKEIETDVKKEADDEEAQENTEDDKEQPIDFTIELTDHDGQTVQFLLSSFSALQREIEVKHWKASFITDESQSENVFQLFRFPLAETAQSNPVFDFTRLKQIDFVFDQTLKGVVTIDGIGFMQNW